MLPGVAFGHAFDALIGADRARLGGPQLLRVKTVGLGLHGAGSLWGQARWWPAAEHAVKDANVTAQGPQ